MTQASRAVSACFESAGSRSMSFASCSSQVGLTTSSRVMCGNGIGDSPWNAQGRNDADIAPKRPPSIPSRRSRSTRVAALSDVCRLGEVLREVSSS